MLNPFEVSDDECSSGDDITKIFESNDDSFDFEKWIIANKLPDLKECFNDHNMNTLETLNLNNPNFTKLMADTRVLIKAHLIQNIVSGIQSLVTLRKSIKKKKDKIEEKEGIVAPETNHQTTNNKKRTLIFMSPNENATFENMQKYIENLTNLRSELKIVTQQDFELTRDKNIEQIEKYEMIHLNKLDGINHKIHSKFEELHNKLNAITKELENKLDEYKDEIIDIKTSHKQLMSIINGKYKHCISMINEDKNKFNNAIVNGQNIIQTYDEKEDNNNYSFKNINRDRENAICNIGNEMQNHYNKSMISLNDNKKEMTKYIQTNMNLPQNDVYYININDNIYKQIVNDINKLITIQTTKQKQQLNKQSNEQQIKPKKIDEKKDHGDDSIMDIINDINKMEQKMDINEEEDISFDNLYCVIFTSKPFGLTFGTNEYEKNLFVTTVDEKSLAFKLNVLIGSKVIKICDDIVRDQGSSNIYKIFNHKFGKTLPLKITFEKPKEINNITFENDINWFNNNIWQLSDNNKTIRNKGDNYEPYKSYAIYLGNSAGYNKGIHFISIKCIKLNEEEGNVKCCIGIICEKKKEWIMKGIDENWPKIGIYSYFDGWAEHPYWYRNETIIVKLDINNLIVSYFTINDKSKKELIKKQQITKAKTYYFMMSVVSDPTVQFSIK